MNTKLITFLLGASNFAVVPMIKQLYECDNLGYLLCITAAYASMVYRLCETKFGMQPIALVSDETVYFLLNMDRLFAVLSITYIALYYRWGQYMVPIVWGLFLNGISELFGRAGYINLFFVTHLAWHLLAYYTGYIIVMT